MMKAADEERPEVIRAPIMNNDLWRYVKLQPVGPKFIAPVGFPELRGCELATTRQYPAFHRNIVARQLRGDAPHLWQHELGILRQVGRPVYKACKSAGL